MEARGDRPLIERRPVEDTFASDLGRIDVFEAHVRFILYSEQFEEEGGPPLRIVGRGHKIILPKARILPAIGRVLFALGYAGFPDLVQMSHLSH